MPKRTAQTAPCFITDRLPAEILREILRYVLSKDSPTEFSMINPVNYTGPRRQRYVANARSRKAQHPGQIYDSSIRRWIQEPPRVTVVLLTCKLAHAEAEEVLYGCNTFSFQTNTRLTKFLTSFDGPTNLIRTLKVDDYIIATAQPFWQALIPLVNLRKVSMGHYGFCRNRGRTQGPTSSLLVRQMTPLLKVLKCSYSKQGLTINPADVLEIFNTECESCSCGCGKLDRKEYCNCKYDEQRSVPKQQELFEAHRASLRDAVADMKP